MSLNYELDDAVRTSIRRMRVVKVDDTGSQQRIDLKGLKNEEPKEIFRPQAHGFTSNPPKDSEGIAFALGGRSDRTVYFDGGHKEYRPKDTPSGGTVLYNHKGDIVSIVENDLRIVHAKKIEMKVGNSTLTILPGKIVLKSAVVELGDEGGVEVGLCGGGCATKVKAV